MCGPRSRLAPARKLARHEFCPGPWRFDELQFRLVVLLGKSLEQARCVGVATNTMSSCSQIARARSTMPKRPLIVFCQGVRCVQVRFISETPDQPFRLSSGETSSKGRAASQLTYSLCRCVRALSDKGFQGLSFAVYPHTAPALAINAHARAHEQQRNRDANFMRLCQPLVEQPRPATGQSHARELALPRASLGNNSSTASGKESSGK